MESFQDARALEREFTFLMPADTTTETGVEVDTDIAAGSKVAWAIVGMRYSFEEVAAPHLPNALSSPASAGCTCLQLVRGALPATPVLIGRQNHDLIGEDVIEVDVQTGVGIEMRTWPREVPFEGVTQLPKLHVTFGTTVDFAAISAATTRMVGVILYNLVTAPKARHEDL
jgi:hypothetical protein